MIRVPTLVLTALLLVSSLSAAEEALPRPAGLEANVRFWTRIYSEIDGQGGFIHDSQNLDAIYEVTRFPPGLSQRAQERRIEKAKKRYAAILRRLAGGKRTDLSPEEARVLARWPAGVTNATLRAAARNVRFQLGQADRFEAGIVRSGAWREYIEQILEAHGVPVEIAALPHVESSYNPNAYSRVGAAGLWQFTRSTGRRFMRVDHVVDERLDARKSTVGAAKLLRENFNRLGSWPLAITAYNHGVSGIARAARKLGTRDIATITKHYKSRIFGFASRNFYAEFLAALDVDREAERFFGPIHRDQPQEFETVVLEHFYTAETLERAFGVTRQTLREYNRALRPAVWNGAKYVPRGYELQLPPAVLTRPGAEILASIPASERKSEQHLDRYYRVRRGDTLSKIAHRYRVRERELVALNNLRSRHRIHAGQVLVLPDLAAGGETRVARELPPADGIYRVRRGDNLSVIARRFGTSESALAAENDLRDRNHLDVGQQLRIPGAASVVVATAENAATTRSDAAPATLEIEPEAEPSATAAATLALAAPVETAEMPLARANFAESVPSPDPSDYAVGPDHRITIQAAETLGHYAEWLEVRASRLRRLNGMKSDTPLVIGRKAKLDFSRVSPETFEQRRLGYHHTLQEEYFAAFEVTGTRTHVLRAGDSLWYLAERKYQVPVWLIRQYNPDLDFGALPAGAHMIIPDVAPRSS